MTQPGLARRAGALLALALLAMLGPAAARAHIVYGRTTLGRLIGNADLAARVRILDAGGVLVLDETGERRPLVVAEALETFKGESGPGPLRLVQHGHGVAEYEEGEEVLIFLQSLERSRELEQLAASREVQWVSLQEHDAKYRLTPASREVWSEAVRAYVALGALEDPEARRQAWGRLTLDLLRSPEPRLSASALNDLVLAGDTVQLTEAEQRKLLEIVRESTGPVGMRLALLAELERRALVDSPPLWVELLKSAEGQDRLAAVRAAGAHPSPLVTAELLRLLGDDDPELVYASVLALGAPGNDAAVEALRRIVVEGDERLWLACIRSLGRIGTSAAIRVLATTAASHPDPATRRRARAELSVLEKERANP